MERQKEARNKDVHLLLGFDLIFHLIGVYFVNAWTVRIFSWLRTYCTSIIYIGTFKKSGSLDAFKNIR